MRISQDHRHAFSVETIASDMAIFRNSILTLSVALQKNAEINFYCEKSNHILDCSEVAFHSHLFWKISPENTGVRVLILVKLQIDCSE